MKELMAQMQIKVNEKIYLKDPYTSELGKNILKQSIHLIDELGLEQFTFKKLATRLETTESSVYRYFENKHKLLMYLTSWYWGWMEYQMVFSTANIECPEKRLKAALETLCMTIEADEVHDKIQLEILYRIVIAESSKAYLIKEVDEANKEGFYESYKRLIKRLTSLVQEINPELNNANSLISTLIEGIYHQKFLIRHFPSLTDLKEDSKITSDFFSELALSYIKK
jgi:AcrR family transcriptional regulator